MDSFLAGTIIFENAILLPKPIYFNRLTISIKLYEIQLLVAIFGNDINSFLDNLIGVFRIIEANNLL